MKRIDRSIEYVQELAIRYLRPPTPPAPGDIVITMEANVATGPAPPLIIRQQPARASTPEPLVVREAPPQPPPAVGTKRITISGKRLPPPPRKVIIERLAPLPSKPQNVIIERWLPYGEVSNVSFLVVVNFCHFFSLFKPKKLRLIALKKIYFGYKYLYIYLYIYFENFKEFYTYICSIKVKVLTQ